MRYLYSPRVECSICSDSETDSNMELYIYTHTLHQFILLELYRKTCYEFVPGSQSVLQTRLLSVSLLNCCPKGSCLVNYC